MTQISEVVSAKEDRPVMPLRIRPTQARALYSLPRERMYAALASGELPSHNVGSADRASYLIKPEDIEAWLETLTISKGKK